jgi:hypothetical protein
MGVSRNAWIVQTLLTELEGVAPAPGKPATKRTETGRRARIEAMGTYGYRAVDADSGETVEGTVRNMRHAAEDEARPLGYEVVDS